MLSVAQLGTRLHVLIDPATPDPAERVVQRLRARRSRRTSTLVRASLEDVFVAATGSAATAGDRQASLSHAMLLRLIAITTKELRQLRRDRLTFGMIIGIPLMQILLFGYAINFDVRDLNAGVVDDAKTESLACARRGPAGDAA